jgi:hypothetical protein
VVSKPDGEFSIDTSNLARVFRFPLSPSTTRASHRPSSFHARHLLCLLPSAARQASTEPRLLRRPYSRQPMHPALSHASTIASHSSAPAAANRRQPLPSPWITHTSYFSVQKIFLRYSSIHLVHVFRWTVV